MLNVININEVIEANLSEYNMNFSWKIAESPDKTFVFYVAIAPDGGQIGDKDTLDMLENFGIQPQLVDSERRVCSIGWSDKEQKWFGWSHRAIFGFSIGSKVKRGDVAYKPVDKEDFMECMIDFWDDEETHENISGTLSDDGSGVYIHWTYSHSIPNESLRGKSGGDFSNFPDEWGRGEWTAESWEDAKQMAIDFAESVS